MDRIIRDLKRIRLSLTDSPYNDPYNETDIEREDNISTLNVVIESLSEHKPKDKTYDIDFSGQVMARVELNGDIIAVIDAMNGYGNPIDLNNIIIKELEI